MPTKTELLPCPFCGGKADDDPNMSPYCIDCGFMIEDELREKSVEMWNTRPRCDQCKHSFDDIVGFIKCCIHMNIFEKDFHCAKFSRREE